MMYCHWMMLITISITTIKTALRKSVAISGPFTCSKDAVGDIYVAARDLPYQSAEGRGARGLGRDGAAFNRHFRKCNYQDFPLRKRVIICFSGSFPLDILFTIPFDRFPMITNQLLQTSISQIQILMETKSFSNTWIP